MPRREKIDWLYLLLSLYLLAIVVYLFATRFDAIQASQPAYEITLIVVAVFAIVGLWRSLFRWHRGVCRQAQSGMKQGGE